MAQFAVHKKGFFYTDEAYEATESVGKLVKVFDNYEDAIVEKKVADIKSMQKLKGQNVVDFFFDNPIGTKGGVVINAGIKFSIK